MKTLFFICCLLSTLVFQSCVKDEVPAFTLSASTTNIVAGQSITFSENSTVGTTQWTFQGGNIPSSNNKSVVVTYTNPGTYNVTVVVTNKSKITTETIQIAVHKTNWSFILPGGGQRNNNATIGDFCCTGETLTISNQSNAPLGYAYFYGTRNTGGIILGNGQVIIQQFELLVSGTTNIQGTNARTQSSIFFPSADCVVGRVKQVQVGNLEYTVKILTIAYPLGTQYVNTHFVGGSLRVEVNVRWVS